MTEDGPVDFFTLAVAVLARPVSHSRISAEGMNCGITPTLVLRSEWSNCGDSVVELVP